MLLKRFTFETNTHIPDHLLEASNDPVLYSNETLGKCQSIIKEYEHFRNRVKKGEFGKTAQFWVLYLDLVKNQYFAHIAVQSNNFDLRLFAWKYMIPFFFVLNKINYARYGSFYTESMGNIEKFYPNLKPLLETKGLFGTGTRSLCNKGFNRPERGADNKLRCQNISRD